MMTQKILNILLISCFIVVTNAQIPQPIKQLLNKPCMQGSSFSMQVKNVSNGEIVYDYDSDRQLTPASVLKIVTTATALEILGKDYRFPTTLEYDGKIINGVLDGNLYIKGSGDPSLGSAHFAPDRNTYTPDQNIFIPQWVDAIKKAGIREIKGSIIADESIFDTEGTSLKWVNEDMGSYYGAGSYGLSVFDNLYKLVLKTGAVDSRPTLTSSDPDVSFIQFHNYLKAKQVSSDSSFITGAPFSTDRYLYGVVPANRENYTLKGDIPDPALFLANYLSQVLNQKGIKTQQKPSCHRLLEEAGDWKETVRKELVTTYSPTLAEIIEVTNHVSHNLFADALLKTIGLKYQPQKGEVISSFDRGVKILGWHWAGKDINISPLWMYDGSGLAASDKVSTAFICDILSYMATESSASNTFFDSLPQAGLEGSVRNFLKGSSLQGKARIKSGSMSRVKGYAGYITKGNKEYAVALFVNNYSCDGRPMTKLIEDMLVALFSTL